MESQVKEWLLKYQVNNLGLILGMILSFCIGIIFKGFY